MLKIPVIFDTKAYDYKPIGDAVGDLKKSMMDAGIVELTLEEIYQRCILGYSFFPGILVGGMKVLNWKKQQLFAIDVDEGISVEEALALYRKVEVEPFAMYYSYSHTEEHPKFRLLFCLDNCLEVLEVRNKVMKILMGILGCADTRCFTAEHYFNGTSKGGEFYGENIVSSMHLFDLWKDDYEYVTSKKRKTASKSRKEDGNKSHRDYIITVNDNVTPWTKGIFKANAEKDITALDRFFELRNWEEGDHRERFVFIYYNIAKLEYGVEKALNMVKEKNIDMDEPLCDRELYWAITHIEEHKEINSNYHKDGVFLFHRETMASKEWLDMTEEEITLSGFLDSSRKNQRAKENRLVKAAIKEQIIKLHRKGMQTAAIAKEIEEKIGVSISKKTIQRYVKCDKIPQTIFYNIFFRDRIDLKESESALLEGFNPIMEESHPALNKRQNKAFNDALKGFNMFISGGAGVGKSHLVKAIANRLRLNGKKIAVCATTAQAASAYEDGVTFHRLFGCTYKRVVYPQVLAKLAEYDVIVIEEVGLLGKSEMDFMGEVIIELMQVYHKVPQIILVGDVLQLPPIEKHYFFESEWYKCFDFKPHYLIENIRQKGSDVFFNCLNTLRMAFKETRVINRICQHNEVPDEIYLMPTNPKAEAKNRECLERVEGEFIDLGNGQFVKIGAKIICNKNKYKAGVLQYYNGLQGTVVRVSPKKNVVTIRDSKGNLVRIRRCEIEEDGRLINKFPFLLGYAITIHKSQGMTLECANIDPEAFAGGQLYVALSRVKSAEGVHLLQDVKKKDIKKLNSEAVKFDEELRQQCGIETVVEEVEYESERE